MSLLGFDALGRWALGQLPSNSSFVLLTTRGSVALAGQSVAFATSEPATTAGFLETGISAGFKLTQPGSSGSSAFAGNATAFGVRLASLAGSFLLTGVTANSTIRTAASTGTILLSGMLVPFFTSLGSGPGAFAWAGRSTAYDWGHEAWVQRPFDTMSWQVAATLPPPAWTGATAAASAWTADVQSKNAWIPASIDPEPWTTE